MKAKRVAVCAVAVALLIAVQFTLSMVPGVELVTVLLLCFCYAFGIYMGMITATCFSLLRCIIFGFYPNVLILYLVYYNVFALIFGILGKHRASPWLCIFIMICVSALSAYFAATGLPISILYQKKVTILLWVLFALSTAILILYCILLIIDRSKSGRETASVTMIAVVCTICFTLLDDVISPLFYGYGKDAAWAYFLASLYVMIPQALCTLLSVFILFIPLKKVFMPVSEKLNPLSSSKTLTNLTDGGERGED